jgi:hypothetical protein
MIGKDDFSGDMASVAEFAFCRGVSVKILDHRGAPFSSVAANVAVPDWFCMIYAKHRKLVYHRASLFKFVY